MFAKLQADGGEHVLDRVTRRIEEENRFRTTLLKLKNIGRRRRWGWWLDSVAVICLLAGWVRVVPEVWPVFEELDYYMPLGLTIFSSTGAPYVGAGALVAMGILRYRRPNWVRSWFQLW